MLSVLSSPFGLVVSYTAKYILDTQYFTDSQNPITRLQCGCLKVPPTPLPNLSICVQLHSFPSIFVYFCPFLSTSSFCPLLSFNVRFHSFLSLNLHFRPCVPAFVNFCPINSVSVYFCRSLSHSCPKTLSQILPVFMFSWKMAAETVEIWNVCRGAPNITRSGSLKTVLSGILICFSNSVCFPVFLSASIRLCPLLSSFFRFCLSLFVCIYFCFC